MYVCLCNGITDNHIARAVAEGADSLRDLKARLGVATCCGRCAECAEFVLDEQLASSSTTRSLQFCRVVGYAARAARA
jgi:bacterioferritin-associated ferredoxin